MDLSFHTCKETNTRNQIHKCFGKISALHLHLFCQTLRLLVKKAAYSDVRGKHSATHWQLDAERATVCRSGLAGIWASAMATGISTCQELGYHSIYGMHYCCAFVSLTLRPHCSLQFKNMLVVQPRSQEELWHWNLQKQIEMAFKSYLWMPLNENKTWSWLQGFYERKVIIFICYLLSNWPVML